MLYTANHNATKNNRRKSSREEFSDKMAVVKKRAKSKWKDFDLQFLIEWTKRLLFDPSKAWIVGLGLLLAEIVVNILVIWKIKCEYFLNGFQIFVFIFFLIQNQVILI